MYSQEWGSVIVDEGQNHTNIQVAKCKAICSIFTRHRWVMSGTMFNEPKVERLLGYYCMIGDTKFPRSLPAAEKFVRTTAFKEVNVTLVHSAATEIKNKSGVVKCNNQIITHQMTPDEEKFYISMNEVLKIVRKKMEQYKN